MTEKKKSTWLDGLDQPCDPKIFERALEVWQAGSQFKLRKTPPTKKGLYLSDIPMNRSAMATIGFLKARGVTNSQAYLWRAMHFGELLQHMQQDGRLAKYVKVGKEKGVTLVSDALLHAIAVAPIKLPNDLGTEESGFDLEEIARIADEIWQADSDGEGKA
jgi:hypothetical protein